MAGLGLTTLLKVASVGATAVSAIGGMQSANAQQAAMEHNAKIQKQAGEQAFAQSQRSAIEERRQKDLMLSRARAVGASSGGGRDYGLEGDIEEEGELRALTRLWQGREAQRGANQSAAATRFEASQVSRAGRYGAATTAIGGAVSFYRKYGGVGPNA